MKSFSTSFLSGAAIFSAVSALATPQLSVEKRAAIDGLPTGGVVSNGVAFGFLPSDGYQVASPAYTMAQINSKLGGKASTYGWYAQISSSTFTGSQLLQCLDDVVASGAVFQPAVMPTIPFSQVTSSVASQVAGVLEQFTAKGVEVWLRFGHEMNYYVTDGIYHGTAAEFVTAWKNIHAAVSSNPKIKMYWSPNVDTSSAPVAPYWPGASYVDVVGVDCYPTSSPLSSSAFSGCYDNFYKTYSAAYNIPFAIGETGYAGSSGNAAWIGQLVNQDMCEYPNYIAASWFEYDKEADFLIVEGSPSILSSAQQLLLHNTKTGCGPAANASDPSTSTSTTVGSTPTTLATKTASATTTRSASQTGACTWGCNGWDCSASIPCNADYTCMSGYCH
ncbi:putative glycoside hydrolase family 26 protein [Botrytis fragariae]|uniref:Putative glycoside hydrolase family 26 protein n=1 Tax=Botrytis fragariae TaxID=1964551 RepID=A0A8H6B540_9HELO|nr:putative glycoside hydrolase family 26 protein [Botrytis fragariae]KAF5879177.1 putative glycoside hydrolase family 26 protein [Botrytis fragariae]